MGSDAVDWDTIWQGDTLCAVPHTSELLEVVTYVGKGRGVRVVGDVKAGTLLLAERATAVAPEQQLAEAILTKQHELDDTAWRQLCLACVGGEQEALTRPVPLSSWPSDALHNAGTVERRRDSISLPWLKRVVDLNAYRCSAPKSEYAFSRDDQVGQSDEERHSSYGLFLLGALINHSCAPNLSKVLLDDWVFLRAARDIANGEEVTQFYCDIRMPVKMRQRELLDLFGFLCDCPRCMLENAVDACGGGENLGTYKSLYSSNMPAFMPHQRSLLASQLEALVFDAERQAHQALQTYRHSCGGGEHGDLSRWEEWMRWPLVPAFSQVAHRLRLDGRLKESMALWRKAEKAVQAVVPLSNVHLRLLAELLLTVAKLNDSALLEESLAASRHATALAYGGTTSVWHELVGFRMPTSVLALVDRLEQAEGAALSPGSVECVWGAVELDGASGLRKATLVARSAAFTRAEDVCFDASERLLVIGAPGATKARMTCPFPADLERVATRFSRRQGLLTVSVLEKASG